MAQAGSFVPAREAKIPLVDRIFARVGASDNIARGHSTFMVEMQETAQHPAHGDVAQPRRARRDRPRHGDLRRPEHRVGGGRVPRDAIRRSRPKTLFATHYHELTDLADATPGVVNFHVAAREWKDDIIFLRKIVPGRSDRSYGIQVARLAGLPPSVIERAREILAALERDELTRGGRPSVSGTPTEPQQQLGLFQAPRPTTGCASSSRAIDVDRMTPLEALTLLAELKQQSMTTVAASAARKRRLSDVVWSLRQPKVAVMLALGFSSGLPFFLSSNTLGYWLRDEGTPLAAIGFLSWVGLAYSLKFLWAPIVDRVDAPGFGRLGRRRGWMLLSQLVVAVGPCVSIGVRPRRRARGGRRVRAARRLLLVHAGHRRRCVAHRGGGRLRRAGAALGRVSARLPARQ